MEHEITIPIQLIEKLQSGDRSKSEIHVVLALARLTAHNESMSFRDLRSDVILRAALSSEPDCAEIDPVIREAVENLIADNLLAASANDSDDFDDLKIRIDRGQQGADQAGGEISVPSPPADSLDESAAATWAFQLYERDVGPLTPLVVDQISLAVQTYPEDWIRDALRDAVTYNRRSWRYIQRILENWASQSTAGQSQESTGHETRRGRPEESIDTSRYRKGKHLERAKRSSV